MLGGLTGREAEGLCAEYLEGKGYRIAARNYSCRMGEIDIIAEYSPRAGLLGLFSAPGPGYIVFVEVKYRSRRDYGEPREAVGFRKQRRIRLTAENWLAENPVSLQPRFDVVEVIQDGGKVAFNHIENAF